MVRVNAFLSLLAVCCALSVVNSNHRARKIFGQLEAEQKRMRSLDIEWGQLQLELSTWAAHARIEKIARERLGMKPPVAGQVISVNAPAGR